MQRWLKRAAFHQVEGILYVTEVIDLEFVANTAFLATGYKFGVPFFRVGKQEFSVLVLEMEGAEVERELIRLRSNVKQVHPLFQRERLTFRFWVLITQSDAVADLRDHARALRHHALDYLAIDIEIGRSHAALVAHMHVGNGRAGVIAIVEIPD